MPNNLQKVNIAKTRAYCEKCGSNILDITKFHYGGRTRNTSTYREEVCTCNKCGTNFILHYDIFTEKGHINPKIFTGDINDPEYNWQDSLSKTQKEAVATHLKKCTICSEKLHEEILSDAWFASIIHGNKNEL